MNEARRLDFELIRRIADRDATAAEELFNRFAPEVFGFLARRVGPEDAQDVLQEVFVRAMRGACRFRGDSSARTWLYSVARFTLMERNRGRMDAQTFIEFTDTAPGPETLALSRDERRQMVAALERLPDDQAVVLELHRIDGLSHEEIAEILEIGPAASRKRLQRATRALEAELQTEDVSSPRHSRIESWRASLLRRAVPEAVLHGHTA